MRHAFPRGFSYDGRSARTLRRRARLVRNAPRAADGGDAMVVDGAEAGAEAGAGPRPAERAAAQGKGRGTAADGAAAGPGAAADDEMVTEVSERLSSLRAGPGPGRGRREEAFSFGRRGRRAAGFVPHR